MIVMRDPSRVSPLLPTRHQGVPTRTCDEVCARDRGVARVSAHHTQYFNISIYSDGPTNAETIWTPLRHMSEASKKRVDKVTGNRCLLTARSLHLDYVHCLRMSSKNAWQVLSHFSV